jgi:DNA-binding beta-propeller fold protein YncE
MVRAPPAFRLAVRVFVACSLAASLACRRSSEPEATTAPAPGDSSRGSTRPALHGVSPRTIGNDTANPLLVFGEGLVPGMKLRLGAPFERELPLDVLSDEVASCLAPDDLHLDPSVVEVRVPVRLVSPPGAGAAASKGATDGAAIGVGADAATEIAVVNHAGFPELFGLALSADGAFAFTVSTTTDTLFVLDTRSGDVHAVAVGDGPRDVQVGRVGGVESAVVVHRHAPEIRVIAVAADARGVHLQRVVPGPLNAETLLLAGDAGGDTAYVAEHAHDTVVAIDLRSGEERFRAPVGPNPRGLALVRRQGTRPEAVLAVGSLLAGETTLLDARDGRRIAEVAPRPGVAILDGRTAPYSDAVIGGKAVRALAAYRGSLFVASIGPNVGPNADRVEVTGVGGVGVIDPGRRAYPRHLGFGSGVPQALAVDAPRDRLYVADVAAGLVHIVDARALIGGDVERARHARLASLPLPPPENAPLVRPMEDFGVNGRAGAEVHTGPQALALSADGERLYVLERFSGRVTRIDTTAAAKLGEGAAGDAHVYRSFPIVDVLAQRERRAGQILYFADVGRTGMSCDSCHLEGHGEGVFYAKTGMMRIWRSPTVRGARDTPPYFNPANQPTLESTAAFVGSRNRFQNPPMSEEEVARLGLFSRTLTTPPNPFRAPTGGLVDALDVGDGRKGRPREGLRHFMAHCAGCHPPPLFSTGQDEATRHTFLRLPTPAVLAIRPELQDTRFTERTPPSLVGAWDVWPMFLSGSAGFGVGAGGQSLEAVDRLPIRAVVDRYAGDGHGSASALPQQARDDLVAFVLSL